MQYLLLCLKTGQVKIQYKEIATAGSWKVFINPMMNVEATRFQITKAVGVLRLRRCCKRTKGISKKLALSI